LLISKQVVRKNNVYFEPIINLVKNVKFMNDTQNSQQNNIILDNLLPNNLDLFYRYEGSLTTPPCSEIVTWIVYSEIIDIGISQVINHNYFFINNSMNQIMFMKKLVEIVL
jgi:carbonic anhydrase